MCVYVCVVCVVLHLGGFLQSNKSPLREHHGILHKRNLRVYVGRVRLIYACTARTHACARMNTRSDALDARAWRRFCELSLHFVPDAVLVCGIIHPRNLVDDIKKAFWFNADP